MNLISALADIIYPPRCPICKEFLHKGRSIRDGDPLSFCPTCTADFRPITSPLCPICGTLFSSTLEEDHPCEDCLRKRPFYEAAWAPYRYEGATLNAIHQLKYGAKSFLADFLGPRLSRFTENRFKVPGPLLTMPVPLHPKRLRERGFNQSLLLARHVAKGLQIDLDFLSLRRIRYTMPQTSLAKKKRQENVRGAFQLKRPEAVRGKTILLVDDVATTGNTLNECAVALKRAGSKKIYCVTLARAVR
ncbi:MAG: ComF family protein [Pseudomonadota bacterium]